jgi:hypothetical protein
LRRAFKTFEKIRQFQWKYFEIGSVVKNFREKSNQGLEIFKLKKIINFALKILVRSQYFIKLY